MFVQPCPMGSFHLGRKKRRNFYSETKPLDSRREDGLVAVQCYAVPKLPVGTGFQARTKRLSNGGSQRDASAGREGGAHSGDRLTLKT
jgi:hypothetical protein